MKTGKNRQTGNQNPFNPQSSGQGSPYGNAGGTPFGGGMGNAGGAPFGGGSGDARSRLETLGPCIDPDWRSFRGPLFLPDHGSRQDRTGHRRGGGQVRVSHGGGRRMLLLPLITHAGMPAFHRSTNSFLPFGTYP